MLVPQLGHPTAKLAGAAGGQPCRHRDWKVAVLLPMIVLAGVVVAAEAADIAAVAEAADIAAAAVEQVAADNLHIAEQEGQQRRKDFGPGRQTWYRNVNAVFEKTEKGLVTKLQTTKRDKVLFLYQLWFSGVVTSLLSSE